MAGTSAKPDLVIRNARLIDGSGGPAQTGDLAIADDRIVALGALNGTRRGAREIDAGGKALAPGFIDPHTHDDRPDLLLLDEPTSALDVSVQAQVLNLFKTLKQKYGFTIVFVTHDLALVSFICDHTIVMKSGAIVEHGPTEEVISNPKADYTRELIRAAPEIPETAAA